MPRILSVFVFFTVFLPVSSFAEPILIKSMQQEMQRFQKATKTQDLPPYYISYEITEEEVLKVESSFGNILTKNYNQSATLDIDLRVGDYNFDNNHPLRNNSFFGNSKHSYSTAIPTDFNPKPLSNRLWYFTEQAYRKAKKDYLTVKANDSMQAEAEDNSADFSKSTVVVDFEKVEKDKLDLELWLKNIKIITAPFKIQPDIYRADASFVAKNEVRWFVNSEGTQVQHFQKSYYLSLLIVSRANDGMEIPRHRTFYTSDLNKFPSNAALLLEVDSMIKEVNELRDAPILNAYAGPAIFSGQASGVLFHEVLGHRVEAERMKNAEDNKTFKHKLHKKVLLPEISVISDPTLTELDNIQLNGHYRYDNQGVKAQPVTIVDKGILKNFLLSRTMVDGFSQSNGHGRKTPGHMATSRQSNLIVKTSKPHTDAQLKQMLIKQIKSEGLEYGLYFDDVMGGFTYTSWGDPNAFKVIPIRVYKIYQNGKEELYRGVDIIGTPLATFDEIKAVGDHYSVFNGSCGAESGFVPAALASPPIYLSKIEVQRQAKSFDRQPILQPVLDNNEFAQQEVGL